MRLLLLVPILAAYVVAYGVGFRAGEADHRRRMRALAEARAKHRNGVLRGTGADARADGRRPVVRTARLRSPMQGPYTPIEKDDRFR